MPGGRRSKSRLEFEHQKMNTQQNFQKDREIFKRVSNGEKVNSVGISIPKNNPEAWFEGILDRETRSVILLRSLNWWLEQSLGRPKTEERSNPSRRKRRRSNQRENWPSGGNILEGDEESLEIKIIFDLNEADPDPKALTLHLKNGTKSRNNER